MLNRRNQMPSDIEVTRAERQTHSRRPLFGKKISKGDAIMAVLGVSLAVASAAFPWYIFYNPQQFGIKAMRFQGDQSGNSPSTLAYQPALIGQPMTVQDIPSMELDLFATATIPGPGEDSESVEIIDQPFPPDTVEYQLIHVANGRAMIQDADGIWVVQPGSLLPDSSRVAQLKQNTEGNWVIVTTLDRIVELVD